MKATAKHFSNMMPHCHGDEKTLISCPFTSENVIALCYYLLVECTNLPYSTEYSMSSTQTSVITASNTPLPTDISSTLTVQHTTQTPVITPSNAPLPTDTSSTETETDGGVPIAGIAGAIVVLILLILLVIVVIVIISLKNRHHKAK